MSTEQSDWETEMKMGTAVKKKEKRKKNSAGLKWQVTETKRYSEYVLRAAGVM